MKRWHAWVAALIVLAAAGAVWIWRQSESTSQEASTLVTIRYGVTPFQDSALPVVASRTGWYRREGLDVRIVDLGWSDVPLALASGSIDVAIYNVDSFMSSSEQLRRGGAEVIFYAPLYVWNGAAIMVHGDQGIRPAGDLAGLPPSDRRARVRAAMEQLRGKRIGVTTGTTFEQTVLDALRVAGMRPSDVRLINARPEDNLAAFLAGDLDAFSGGLTERVQARRRGAAELVIGPDVSVPALNGIVARRDFAEAHPREMQQLVDLWFETIRYMQTDLRGRSEVPRSYLRGRASVDYTSDEYAIAWTFDHFPVDRAGAVRDFLSPASIYHWRPIWQSNSDALIGQRRITNPVPQDLFWGERTLLPRQPETSR